MLLIGVNLLPARWNREAVGEVAIDQTQATTQLDRLKAALRRDFLSDQDWDSLLTGVPADLLVRAVDGQPAEFWKTSPIAESAAYRIFGALGRLSAPNAMDAATEVFTRKELNPDFARSCFRWAVLGIAENWRGFLTGETLAKCPSGFRAALIQGAIGGSDGGGIAADMQSFQALLASLPPLAGARENQARTDELLGVVVDAWIARDPAAVLSWLQTAEGKPFLAALPGAVAAIVAGNVDAAARLLEGPASPVKPDDLASACYTNSWAASAIGALAAKLPAAKRGDFLVAYARQLAEGCPRTLLDFVNTADPGLLVPGAVKVLGPHVLGIAPRLFEKLSSQMTPAERNQLLDESYERIRFWTEESFLDASTMYLEMRGAAGPKGGYALISVAHTDLQKALDFASAAPQERQKGLLASAYSYRLAAIAKTESVDTLFHFLQSEPPELAADSMEMLSLQAPDKCFEMLVQNYPTDAKMWATVCLGTNGHGTLMLNGDQLNTALAHAIKGGMDPAIYAVAARGITIEFAKDDIDEACASVEALPDPKVKEVCTAAMIEVWGQTDPLRAFGYIGQLPSGGRRDAAIAALLPALGFAADKRQELLALASSDAVRASMNAPPGESGKKSP